MTTPTTERARALRAVNFRWLRWILLIALGLVVLGVGIVYRARRLEEKAERQPPPARLSADTKANAVDFEWGQSADGKPRLHMFAKSSEQNINTNNTQLKGLELRIYAKDGKTFDRVSSETAEFSTDHSKLYAPGEAVITLNLPVAGEPKKIPTSIRAAGINFNSQTGQAVTNEPVAFAFEGGEGTCSGAAYDPQTHELKLLKDVSLNLHGKGAKATPMRVEARTLTYSESDSLVRLEPWSRMTREGTTVNAGTSVIHMQDKRMQSVDADHAAGSDKRPGKDIEYSADKVHVEYNDDGEMEKMNAAGNAKLISHGSGSNTRVTGSNIDLFFNTETGESVLSSATATGNAAIESKPVADPKGNTPDTKLLKADALDMHMKADGKEIDRINTRGPGVLDFLPNQIARHRRVLKASDMDIRYGAKTEIQSFHAVNSATETHPSEQERRKPKPDLTVAYTTSKTIDAAFDDNGQLREMKQTGDFRYTEGARKAQADVATLESERNVMNLETHARIGDESGSTAADHIQLMQSTGDFDARGHVSTTRLPDAKKTSSDMLDGDEPTQGTADRVTSANRNRLVHYEGNAVLWQSSNRVQADKVDIDREKKSMVADGHVVSQFEETPKPAPGAKATNTAPVVTIVRAPHMVYTDADRVALYTGGTDFRRPTLAVKSSTLKAYLNDAKTNPDSRINHAFADGKVEIVDLARDRQRIGTSEHAEYTADEGKIVLSGGAPHLKDSLKGDTTGDKLTYFTEDDRLLVEAPPQGQVKTHLTKKKR